MLQFKSTTAQKVPLYINPTAEGKASAIEGSAKVTFDDGSAATFLAATDEEKASSAQPGLAGFFVSEDKPGKSTGTISGDADLGADDKEISDTFEYTYEDPQADAIGASTGDAVNK